MERTGELGTGSFGGIKADEKSDNGLRSGNWISDQVVSVCVLPGIKDLGITWGVAGLRSYETIALWNIKSLFCEPCWM